MSHSDDRYRAVLARLQSRGRFGIRLGLERTHELLRRLDNPHRELRGALIGGTNGKGSVQELVGSALREAGYRVGQTPKPHLVTYRERITVDGQPISKADFADLVEEVLDHAAAVERDLGAPTEFEVLTAAAFTWFRRQKVDVAVVEVGLGGRLDATNVWQGGVAAITNVALDHTEHLGPTIEAIAHEKAPIIKGGDFAAVTGADEPALKVIRQRAFNEGVPLDLVEPWPMIGLDRRGTTARRADGTQVRIGLLGRHQATNAAIASHILDALEAAGIATVSESQRVTAFAAARWPGRLELIRATEGRPDVLLDGAHNPHGAAALAAAVDELIDDDQPVTLLIGIVREKDATALIGRLRAARALHRATVIATDVPDTERSTPAAELAALWPGATATADTDAALDQAMSSATDEGGIVVVAGSLYLVGHVRARLLSLEKD